MLARYAFSCAACRASCCVSASATASARSPLTPASVLPRAVCWADAAVRSIASCRAAARTEARWWRRSEKMTRSRAIAASYSFMTTRWSRAK